MISMKRKNTNLGYMKIRPKQTLLLIACVLTFGGFAQRNNNLVVFCNDGEAFTLVLNGAQQNATPLTRIVVQGLDLPEYQVHIIFKNPKLKPTDTKLTFFRTNKECEFALNKKGKKSYTMDYFTERDILVEAPVEDQGSAPVAPLVANPTTDQVTPNIPPTDATIPVTDQVSAPVTPTNVIPAISPSQGCVGMSDTQFTALKNVVAQQKTDDARRQSIYKALENGCLFTGQLKQVLGMISSEQVKLDVVKNVYPHIKDLGNYSQLLDNFINMQQELKTFISSQKKQ